MVQTDVTVFIHVTFLSTLTRYSINRRKNRFCLCWLNGSPPQLFIEEEVYFPKGSHNLF